MSNPRITEPKAKEVPWGFQRNGRTLTMELPPPGKCPPFDKADAAAWKHLNTGTAPKNLQERAMEHLAFITGFNADPYVPGDPQATAYNAGRRSVFVAIFGMIQLVVGETGSGEGEQG